MKPPAFIEKIILAATICLAGSFVSSCQYAPSLNTLSSVKQNNNLTVSEIPIEKIIHLKTPNVLIAQTKQELDFKIKAEIRERFNKESEFETLQVPSEGDFEPDVITVTNLANGNVQFDVITKSKLTYVNLLGKTGHPVSFYLAHLENEDPLVTLNSSVNTPGSNLRDHFPPDDSPSAEIGGLLNETIKITFEWEPLERVRIPDPSGNYNPYCCFEIVRRPNEPHKIFTQSMYFDISNVGLTYGDYYFEPPGIRAIYDNCRYGIYLDRSIHYNDDGNGIHDNQNYTDPNYCTAKVGPLNIKEFSLGKLLIPLDVPQLHEKPTTIDQFETIDGEEELISSELIFSPRDRNGIYDRLQINVLAEDDVHWRLFVNEPGLGLDKAIPVERVDGAIQGIGSKIEIWDGHLKSICLNDGHFEIYVVDDENNILQSETFYIDNTAPVITTQTITERVIQEQTLVQDEIVKTDVSLSVMDIPYYEDTPAAGITDEDSLNLVVNAEVNGLIINDPEKFEILGETNKDFDLKFTVDGRLLSRFLHISFQDDVGNTENIDLAKSAEAGN